MKIQSVQIANFKAINKAKLDFDEFNVLVGTNGSGKSSVLQALHWFFETVKNPSLNKTSGSYIIPFGSESYSPASDFKEISHGNALTPGKASKSEISIEFDDDTASFNIDAEFSSARNGPLRFRSEDDFRAFKKEQLGSKTYSSYIPGLAGIALGEEKIPPAKVAKIGASGDANTVLRNLLYMINQNGDLGQLQQWLSDIFGEIRFRVKYIENEDPNIHVDFQTGAMRRQSVQRFKPIETMGTGFLQATQIFAYLVYFQPKLLLIDEPDSHLHPDMQEKLVSTLQSAARAQKSQVVLTTHSQAVLRSLSPEANVIWLKDGEVAKHSDRARIEMGWGILGKELILLSEDRNSAMLKTLLGQWPELERKVAIWNINGVTKFPEPDILQNLQQLFGGYAKLLIHRDRDFMSPREIELWKENYQKGCASWVTEPADIEGYFCAPDYLQAVLGMNEDDVNALLQTAWDLDDETAVLGEFNNKRKEIVNDKKIKFPKGEFREGDEDVYKALRKEGPQYVRKKFLKKIRTSLHKTPGWVADTQLANQVPAGIELAADLRIVIETLLGVSDDAGD